VDSGGPAPRTVAPVDSCPEVMTIASLPNSPPDFAIVMRGYDRAQVDDYVSTMQRLLDEARKRAQEAAEATARAGGEAAGSESTIRLASEPTAEMRAVQPGGIPDFTPLGERIVALLRLAEEDAASRRQRGEQEAAELVAAAQREADELRTSAQGEVDEIRAARANAKREAKAALDSAREQAEDLLQRTRRHAEDQAEAIVTQAEADAQRLLEETRETSRVRLQESERRRQEQEAMTAAAEQRHRQVIEDLARLRSTLAANLGGGDEGPAASGRDDEGAATT
jgi:vacuolar-type H+-ATPase subunit H